MKSLRVIALVLAGMFGLCSLPEARVTEGWTLGSRTTVSPSSSGGEVQNEDIILTGILPVVTGERFVFVQVSLEGALAPGTEVEVWPLAPDGSVDASFGRNLWITDERTGTVVNFDITRIANAWAAGTLTNSGLLIRVLDGEGTEIPGADAGLFSSPVLSAHTIPLPETPRLIGVDPGGKRDRERPTDGSTGEKN